MKKSLQLSLGLLVFAVTLALVLPVAAKTTKPPAKKKTEHHTVAYWEVGSADASASTLELAKSDASSNLTLKVTSGTKIMVDGKPGKLADLQKGQKVNFTATGDTCSSIETSAAKEEKKTTKKK